MASMTNFGWMSMLSVYVDSCIDSNHILSGEISLIDAIVIAHGDKKHDLLVILHRVDIHAMNESLSSSFIYPTRVSRELNFLTDHQREISKQEVEEIDGNNNNCSSREHQQNAPETIQKSKAHAGYTG